MGESSAPLRRLDWRFLLPTRGSAATDHDSPGSATGAPEGGFGDVVLLGGSTELARLVEDVGLARRVRRDLDPDSADAVFILADAWEHPEDVSRCLRPSGVLYWEIDRAALSRVRLTPARFGRRLEAEGLSPAGAYACIPNVERCKLYLPIGVPAALEWYLSTQFPAITPSRRLLTSALHLLTGARTDRAGPLFPYYAQLAVAEAGRIAGARAGAGTPAAAGDTAGAGAMRGPAPSLLDTPGFADMIGGMGRGGEDFSRFRPVVLTDAGNRIAMLPFAPEESRPRAVLKVPKLPSVNDRTENEHARLTGIRESVSPMLRQSMPRPLGLFEYAGASVAAESFLPGTSLLASSGRWGSPLRNKLEDLRLAAEWLADFHMGSELRRVPWDSETVRRWVGEPISSFEDAFGTTSLESRLFDGMRQQAADLLGLPFPVVWHHRDYNVWNIFRDNDRIAVIDWEGARPGPPLCDLLHFVTHWNETVLHLRGPEDQVRGLERLFFAPAGSLRGSTIPRAVQDVIGSYMRHLQLDENFLSLLLAYTWIELALRRRRQQVDLGEKREDPREGNRNFPFVTLLARHTDRLFSARTPWEAGEHSTDEVASVTGAPQSTTAQELPRATAVRSSNSAEEQRMPDLDTGSLRLLFLLPFAPRLDADHGGSRVMAELLVRLARHHDLALVYLRAAKEPPLDPLLRQRSAFLREVRRPRTGDSAPAHLARRFRLLGGLLARRPTLVSRWKVPEFASRVREVAAAWEPDIVQVEFTQMAQYAAAVENCSAPRVLTVHEPGAVAALGTPAWSRGFRPAIARLELNAWRAFMGKALSGFDAVVTFTSSDGRALRNITPDADRPVFVRIPIGTAIPEHTSMNLKPANPPKLLYIGNYDHPPNVDAALRLIRHIFPRIRRAAPESELLVVGPHPTSEMRAAAGEGVYVTGHVPEVLPFLELAALIVIPLRTGGGMRVKLLEALAHGKAVVGTPLSAAGLDLIDGVHMVFAETDDELAHAAIALLRDPERRRRMGRAAREWAAKNARWDTSVALYQDLYHRLLKK